MTTKVIVSCDRCGKEMLKWEKESTTLHVYRPPEFKIDTTDLCEECNEAFELWLKGVD